MDKFELIAALVGHLAWPLVTVTILYIFRADIRSVLGSLRKFTWGDKVAEFDQRLDKAEDKARELPLVAEGPLSLPPPDGQLEEKHFEAILEVSPDLAVLEAWLPVERELEALAARRGYETSRIRSPTYAIRRLRSDGVLDRRVESLINELRKLRNLAAHRHAGPPLTVEDARRYEELASAVVDALRAMP